MKWVAERFRASLFGSFAAMAKEHKSHWYKVTDNHLILIIRI
jgi:hypothetical protein